MRRALLITASLFSATAWADSPVRVVDATTHQPLAQVSVRLPDGHTVLTGDDGSFVLSDESGTLVLTLEGYAPSRVKLTAGAPPTELRLDPTFYPAEEIVVSSSRYGADLHLSVTNITREDIEEQHTTEDIPQLLDSTPSVYASSDSGVGIGYDYLTLRGFDQRRLGVMINGVPLNDPEDHQVYWVDMPDLAASLQDVQVQRGVSNSVGGMTAIGGTVNLVTNVHTIEPGGKLSLYLGSYNTSKQALSYRSGLRKGWFSTAMRLSHIQTDGYRERSGSEQSAWFWSAQAITPATTTTLNIYSGHEVTEQAWYGLSDSQLAQDRRQNPQAWQDSVDDFRQPHYELHNQWDVSDAVVVNNSAWWVHGAGFWSNFKEDRLARDYSLDLSMGLAPDDEVDLERREWVEKDQVGWVPRITIDHAHGRLVIGGSGWIFHSHHWGELTSVQGLSPTDLDSTLSYYDWEGDKWSGSGFLNEQLELFEGFVLLTDLHYQIMHYEGIQNELGHFTGADRNQWMADWAFFNPKGGFSWTPGDLGAGTVGVYGHVGIAHQEPADSALFDVWQGPGDLGVKPLFEDSTEVMKDGEVTLVKWSNPRVQPERVVDWEGGLSWRSPTVHLALNGYWMDFQNEMVAYGGLDDDGFAIQGNADHTLHRGVELQVDAQVAPGHELHLAGSKSWDVYQDFTVYEDQWDPDTWEYQGTEAVDLSGNPIAGFPDHLLSVRWTSKLGPATAGLRVRSVGRQYLDNTGLVDHSVDGWQTLDLSLALDLGELGVHGLDGAIADVRLNNVLDAEYQTHGYYDSWGEGRYTMPAAGRNLMAGVRYDF